MALDRLGEQKAPEDEHERGEQRAVATRRPRFVCVVAVYTANPGEQPRRDGQHSAAMPAAPTITGVNHFGERAHAVQHADRMRSTPTRAVRPSGVAEEQVVAEPGEEPDDRAGLRSVVERDGDREHQTEIGNAPREPDVREDRHLQQQCDYEQERNATDAHQGPVPVVVVVEDPGSVVVVVVEVVVVVVVTTGPCPGTHRSTSTNCNSLTLT